MKCDFLQFLKVSQERCKTRDEFIERISEEIKMVNKMRGDPRFQLEKQAYLKRLDGADFAAEYDLLKKSDKYNEELMVLLQRLP